MKIAYPTGHVISPFFILIAIGTLLTISRADDVVIMPDGYMIRGKWYQESELVPDGVNGQMVRITKSSGFQVMDEGARLTFFSRHAQRGGKLNEGAARPPELSFKRKLVRDLGKRLPNLALHDLPEFNDRWMRTLRSRDSQGAIEFIDQQITSLDPVSMMIESPTHSWRMGRLTSEEGPESIRKLLGKHPDLRDPPEGAEAGRRLKIAQFLQEADWPAEARKELDKMKQDVPGPWDKGIVEAVAKLRDSIEKKETRRSMEAIEQAVAAGRYESAARMLKGLDVSKVEPTERDAIRFSEARATVETLRPRYELARRLLNDLIFRSDVKFPHRALGGAAVLEGITLPQKSPSDELSRMVEAAQTIVQELHPDTARRLELFIDTAKQAEQRRSEGRDPGRTSTELYALALTGWTKGKNGADTNGDRAIQCWETRRFLLDYLREESVTERKVRLAKYLANHPLPSDELAQIVTLLPPSHPDDLNKIRGNLVPADKTFKVDEVYRCDTGNSPKLPTGVEYCLRLPSEYHHGRPHPVLVALSSFKMTPEMMVGALAREADLNGFIVVAVDWTRGMKTEAYDYTGRDHPKVTAVLRDLERRFRIDSDKVHLFGVGQGADFALDMGNSKPDLFASVVLMNPNPAPTVYREFWHNTQKLPIYIVCGESSGDFANIKILFDNWAGSGFPALLTTYRGRGGEWFGKELPRLFDWMTRKTRARGIASLKLDQKGFESWQIVRETDDRFYWIGAADGSLKNANKLADGIPKTNIIPASFTADISRDNRIVVAHATGMKKIVIWLERDMIDWSRPVHLHVNGHPSADFKDRKLDPDVGLMLEELFRTGDRKMLFFGKIESRVPSL